MSKLNHALVLNRFMLHLFGANSFEAFSEFFNDSRNEGLDDNNISNFYHILITRLFSSEYLNKDILLEYDQNIVRHSQQINQDRTEPITWKYFQYLSLLFTEIYLDKYFSNRYKLLADINSFIERFNNPIDRDVLSYLNKDEFPEFIIEDLNKLAFWNATGSGKTLSYACKYFAVLALCKKIQKTCF